VNVLQPAPWQRSNKYPVTPPLSVEAVHDTLICVLAGAVAVRFDGTEGAIVSAVVALAVLE